MSDNPYQPPDARLADELNFSGDFTIRDRLRDAWDVTWEYFPLWFGVWSVAVLIFTDRKQEVAVEVLAAVDPRPGLPGPVRGHANVRELQARVGQELGAHCVHVHGGCAALDGHEVRERRRQQRQDREHPEGHDQRRRTTPTYVQSGSMPVLHEQPLVLIYPCRTSAGTLRATIIGHEY